MHAYQLTALLLLLPLIGGLGILLLPRGRQETVRNVALACSLITFALSLLLLWGFDFTRSAELQLGAQVPWVSGFGLEFSYGIDAISLWLILLTTFLMPLVVLGSFNAVQERAREFYLWLLVLEAAMVGVFIATDIIFFYVCFEFTLIPMYFLIGIFGSNQRLKAARVFFLYTFTGSMLTFAGVLYAAWWHASTVGHWSFGIADLVAAAGSMPSSQQMWILLALLAGFAVKVPIFPVHTWLPLAHTEAPTAGSVILAGVLLKLGTYGLIRLAIPMTPEAVIVAAPWIGTLAVIGILYTALICWVQKDIKKLIAYSSVSHLGFCVLGMFALNTQGMTGSVLYMVNHGLSTGALFLCIGMIYERLHTREMAQMSGLAKVMPVWAFFMVFFSLASVGLPGLNGFVSEFLTLLGAFTSLELLGPRFAVFAAFGMIFAAMYLLYMLGKVCFGPLKIPAGHHHGLRDLSLREIVVLTPLAIGCVWLGLFPTPVLRSLEEPVMALAQPAHHALAARQETDQAVTQQSDVPQPRMTRVGVGGEQVVLQVTER